MLKRNGVALWREGPTCQPSASRISQKSASRQLSFPNGDTLRAAHGACQIGPRSSEFGGTVSLVLAILDGSGWRKLLDLNVRFGSKADISLRCGCPNAAGWGSPVQSDFFPSGELCIF